MAGYEDECSTSLNLGHPLATHCEVDPSVIQKLADIGIIDAEQFLAITAIDDVREHLINYLGISKSGLEQLTNEARKATPQPIAAEFMVPDPYEYGLGAMQPTYATEADSAPFAPATMDFVAALPPSVNLISKMPPIRNQASRGTCVAFTITSIHDYATRLPGNLPNNFSEQHLYYETKLIDGSPSACGTFQAKAAIALANRGQCREAIWPYNPNPPCNNHGPLPTNARPDGLHYRFQLTGFVGAASRNVQWIKTNLAAKKPVGISIPVYNSWYSSAYVRKTGAINARIGNEPPLDGGHAVCLVGYQDSSSAPGGGYFLVRNSWSTAWANQSPYGAGYGTIPYRYIAVDNWEAFAPVSVTALEDETDGRRGEDEVTPAPRTERTVTIRVKGNVNLVVE